MRTILGSEAYFASFMGAERASGTHSRERGIQTGTGHNANPNPNPNWRYLERPEAEPASSSSFEGSTWSEAFSNEASISLSWFEVQYTNPIH